jgi:hypothetical protein
VVLRSPTGNNGTVRVKLMGHEIGSFPDEVRAAGFELVEDRPDVVIAYGGDGTFIGSERQFPGIPKVGIRREDTTIKCAAHRNDVVLARLMADRLEETQLLKLEATFNGTRLCAVNDVILRNSDPRTAVRFRVHLNGRRVTEEMIADGLVACTPFGSSAYFRSITRTMIRTGIGLAFNNCTDLLNHLVIGENEKIVVAFARGPATLVADNDPAKYDIEDGDEVHIRRAEETFRVLGVDTLRCAECRYVHAPRRRY